MRRCNTIEAVEPLAHIECVNVYNGLSRAKEIE